MDREKMKNVLILSDAFPPAFNPRMGYLCKYLPEYGWNPVVIAEYSPQIIFDNLSNASNINYINFFFDKNGKIKKLKYLLVFIAEYFFNYKNIIFKRKAEKIIKENDISVILASVSWRAFPALTAKWISKKYNIPFIVDCRDIYEQFPNREYSSKFFLQSNVLNKTVDFFIQRKYKNQRNKILREANALTTVSEWHTKKLSEYNKNTSLIFNGFDDEVFYFKPLNSKIFKISYPGRIESEAVKDPSLLFESISYLYSEKLISPDKLRLQFYLLNQSSKNIIKKLAEKYQITMFVDIFDEISNEKIPDILNESSILLLLANRAVGEKTPKGIMGTKVFEYIAVEKPVLCVRNDESCLEETINSSRSGISASNVEEVNQFIMEKYTEWEKNGFTRQKTNRNDIEKFSRRYQTKQFVSIFESQN